MGTIRKLIRKIISESYTDLNENTIHLAPENIPAGIRNWAKSLGGVSRYKVIQNQHKVTINQPWNIADFETYQFFKLMPNGDAIITGNELTRSGNESDSPQGHEEGMRKEGTVEIPAGFVLAVHGTYPKRVEIFTGPGAQLALPDTDLYSDLTIEQLIALHSAKALKSFARPKFPEEVYAGLIAKGLMMKNKSLTVAGRNALEDASVKDRLRNVDPQIKMKYSIQGYF